MRDAIRMVFDEAEDIELVGEAANGRRCRSSPACSRFRTARRAAASA